MTARIPEELRAAGHVDAFDLSAARMLAELVEGEDPLVIASAALASAHTRRGHVCVDLYDVGDLGFPDVDDWCRALSSSALVGGADGPRTPLVLVGTRLYLRRYFEHEAALAQAIRSRVARAPAPAGIALSALFGAPPPSGPDLQRRAAEIALDRRLTVVSGGPGTGKTTVVARILAALLSGDPGAHVRLLAPTGKAAARLEEAVRAEAAELDLPPEVRAAFPETASTIHRALRPVGGSRVRFAHDAEHPLPDDIVVVDEASMVDLALMRRLLEAIPQRARVILLGDKDQLASVEAGAVLGELCAGVPPLDALEREGIWDCVVQLEHSYRFADDEGIGALSRAIRRGDPEGALRVLDAGGSVRLLPRPAPGTLGSELGGIVAEGYGPLCRAAAPADGLAALRGFRLLCAHRRGPWGVEGLNPAVERALARTGGLQPDGPWYARRPLLVTRNDYRQGLFNGDQGVLFRVDDALRAWFVGTDGALRALAPGRLPPHETALAMSVHKSQGSEFEEVAVVLPPRGSPLLTRELLYTAVTRARSRVVLVGAPVDVRAAIETRVRRTSGLGEAVWR